MNTTAKSIGAAFLITATAAWAQTPSPDTVTTPEWAVSSAPARFVVEPDQPAKPAVIYSVPLCVPNLSWLNTPILVFSDNGTPVGCDLLWTAPNEPATLLFNSAPGAKQYKIYVGSNWPAKHLDDSKAGVIMESRAGLDASRFRGGLLLASEPDTTAPPSALPRILSATYGAGSVEVDVTDDIKDRDKKGQGVFISGGWPDPLPGVAKNLSIKYALNGTIYDTSYWDGEEGVNLRDIKSVNNLDNTLAEWNKSKTIYGRVMVGGIFEGGNRFGIQNQDLLEHFQGWFDVAAPEHLQLAVISYSPTFLLIDGKLVDRGLIQGEVPSGPYGQFVGSVDLTPGRHLMECYLAYRGAAGHYWPLMCCVAAKGGSLDKWTSLAANSGFFRPSGGAHVVGYELQSSEPGATPAGNAPPFAIDWAVNSQSLVAPDTADIGFISEQFNCRSSLSGAVTWTFDDGTTADGMTVQHVFARQGMHTVRVTMKGATNDLGSLVQTINVQPNWLMLNSVSPQLFPEHATEIKTRDPSALSTSDLVGCMAVFWCYWDTEGLLKFLPAMAAKMKDVPDADLPYMEGAANFLADQERLHLVEAAQLFKALVDRSVTATATRDLVRLGSRAREHLAALLLATTDQTDGIKPLLDGVKGGALNYEEGRQNEILYADLALAKGDVADARALYLKVRPVMDPTAGIDARSSIRLTAILDRVRGYIEQKDYSSAEDGLGQVAWYAPEDKMAPPWALLRLRLYQEEGLTGPAYIWANRLLPVITDNSRSELLYRLTDLAFAQKRDDVAKKALTELLLKYPYSEEAAKAKEKWPGKI